MNYINTRQAVRKLNVHPNTLRNWADANKIKHVRIPGGHRRYAVDDFLGENKKVQICYCRVSSYKQKDDLARQIEFMRNKFPEAKITKDIGSGINFKRKGLKAVLEQAMRGDSVELISAHRDRLCRFGFDLITWIIERSGGKVVVLNDVNLSPEEEITKDLLTILHVFSCRMHGLRSYKNKIAKDQSNKRTKKDI